MKILNQRDFPNLYMGESGLSVSKFGCYSVCLAILAGLEVEELVKLFNEKYVYTTQGFIKHPDDKVALGFERYYKTTQDPKEICIAEVDFNPDPKKDQHFVVWLGDGNIIDPWGGIKMKNPYKVYSYRVYKPLKETMSEEKGYYVDSKLRKAIETITETSYDDKLGNEEVQEEAARDLNGAWESIVKERIESIDENAKLNRENIRVIRDKEKALNNLNALKLTSAEDIRNLKDEVRIGKEELEECVEYQNCPVAPKEYSWGEIIKIVVNKIKSIK